VAHSQPLGDGANIRNAIFILKSPPRLFFVEFSFYNRHGDCSRRRFHSEIPTAIIRHAIFILKSPPRLFFVEFSFYNRHGDCSRRHFHSETPTAIIRHAIFILKTPSRLFFVEFSFYNRHGDCSRRRFYSEIPNAIVRDAIFILKMVPGRLANVFRAGNGQSWSSQDRKWCKGILVPRKPENRYLSIGLPAFFQPSKPGERSYKFLKPISSIFLHARALLIPTAQFTK
jgi:hypothetical protein